jgi:hypothetical protein
LLRALDLLLPGLLSRSFSPPLFSRGTHTGDMQRRLQRLRVPPAPASTLCPPSDPSDEGGSREVRAGGGYAALGSTLARLSLLVLTPSFTLCEVPRPAGAATRPAARSPASRTPAPPAASRWARPHPFPPLARRPSCPPSDPPDEGGAWEVRAGGGQAVLCVPLAASSSRISHLPSPLLEVDHHVPPRARPPPQASTPLPPSDLPDEGGAWEVRAGGGPLAVDLDICFWRPYSLFAPLCEVTTASPPRLGVPKLPGALKLPATASGDGVRGLLSPPPTRLRGPPHSGGRRETARRGGGGLDSLPSGFRGPSVFMRPSCLGLAPSAARGQRSGGTSAQRRLAAVSFLSCLSFPHFRRVAAAELWARRLRARGGGFQPVWTLPSAAGSLAGSGTARTCRLVLA